MQAEMIFVVQLALSLVVLGALAKWKLSPMLRGLSREEALFWLISPHAFRHIGLSFLVPNLNSGPLPESFSVPTAYGDLVAGILAMVSLVALRSGWKLRLPVVWVFNVWGALDLIVALSHPEVVSNFGPTWFIPTFIVPALLVTHALTFGLALRRTGRR